MSVRLPPVRPQTHTSTTQTHTSTTTPTTAASTTEEAAPTGKGILQALGSTRFGNLMMGAAAVLSSTSPVLQPVMAAYAKAPERLADDGRTVNFLQARADGELRAQLLKRSGKATVDDIAVVPTALEKGRITGAQTQKLVRDLIQKRGLTGDAATLVTTYFAANEATLAPPLKKHAAVAAAVDVKGPLVVSDSARVTDVRQGAVGDCYLAAAAAALVNRDPSFPNRIIEARADVDGNAFYAVTLSPNFLNLPQGSRSIVVDDAVWAKGGRPLYGQNGANGAAHWFQVVEQAAARLDGDFNKLESGFGFEALSRLTGLRASFTLTTAAMPRQHIFELLHEANAQGLAMTTGAHAFPDAAFVKKHPKDFATMHEYAILDVKGTSASDGVVVLYNPWGKTLEVTIEEYARNFLGFSAVDLGEHRGPVSVDPPLAAILPKRGDEVVDHSRRVPERGQT